MKQERHIYLEQDIANAVSTENSVEHFCFIHIQLTNSVQQLLSITELLLFLSAKFLLAEVVKFLSVNLNYNTTVKSVSVSFFLSVFLKSIDCFDLKNYALDIGALKYRLTSSYIRDNLLYLNRSLTICSGKT